MSNSPSQQELTDWELAKKIQEEWNKEPSQPTNQDPQKKLQEELDLQLALKLQQELYADTPPLPPPPIPKPPKLPVRTYDKNEVRPPPTSEAIKRIMTDYQELLKSNNPLIHASIDEEDVTHVEALIIGPPDTPYDGGFFHFDMIFPSNYPWSPPKVTLVTTDNGRVRFNPNLYANGKVCLSILGTWSGPSWSSIQSMLSTLISIQSLMNATPYHNEPGYEIERHPGDVQAYNECIQHETLRVAVCGMLERPTCNIPAFEEVMEEFFLTNYEKYVKIAEEKAPLLDGKPMHDPFGESRGYFNYKGILTRLENLKKKIEEKRKKRSVNQIENKDEIMTESPALKKAKMNTSTSENEAEGGTNNSNTLSTESQNTNLPQTNPTTNTTNQNPAVQSSVESQPQVEHESLKPSLPSNEKKDQMMISPPNSPLLTTTTTTATDSTTMTTATTTTTTTEAVPSQIESSHDLPMSESSSVPSKPLISENLSTVTSSTSQQQEPQQSEIQNESLKPASPQQKMDVESSQQQQQQQPPSEPPPPPPPPSNHPTSLNLPKGVDPKIAEAGTQLLENILNVVQQASTQPFSLSSSLLDEEIAIALQEQYYKELGDENLNESEEQTRYQATHTKVKPPPLSELKAQIPNDSDYDPNIVCLVCRQSPNEYIILPNCAQPHVYCVSCAQKLMETTNTQPPRFLYSLPRRIRSSSNQPQITCVLCKSVTYIDIKIGLEGLKRRRKRQQVPELTPDFCSTHKTEHIMFCLKSMQLICPQCLLSEPHKRHNDDDHKAIEDAVSDVDKRLTQQISTLHEKLRKLNDFVLSVNNQKEKIAKSVQNVKKEIKEKLEDLKKSIEEKITELNKQIDTVQSTKERNLESEIGKATKKLETIQKAIEQARSVQQLKSSPVDFLSSIENCEEDLRMATLILEPKVEQHWFKLPQLRLNYIEEMVRTLRYKDNRIGDSSWGDEYYEEDYASDEE